MARRKITTANDVDESFAITFLKEIKQNLL
jgi:hypothetical protein